MIMIAQSQCTEDSQGRQLRVNKKLSKAISSVPRSRFQKPRPNLPGSKRPDTNSVSANTRKSVEIPEKPKNPSSTLPNIAERSEEISCSRNDVNEISLDENTKETVLLQAKGTPVKDRENVISTTVSVPEKETENSTLLESNTYRFCDNERLEKEERNILPCINETCKKTDDPNIIKDAINTESKSPSIEDSKSISSLNAEATLPKKDNLNIVPSTVEKIPADSTNTETVCANPLPNHVEQERSENTNIPQSITDKSSKYPHLTSILSKKRPEQKKEVQHKKRKKFKKDVAPERSKMTMADLIYWNPSANQSVKNVSTVDDTPDPPNEVEECVDGEVQGNNLCDSVPKLVISEDGQIVIDQSSLIVSRNIPQPTSTKVLKVDETTYSSFRKRPLTKHWSAKDTTIFYKALSLVGTDFGLMEKIFPHRTRRELKHKFKREEKFNIDLINRAMYESQLTFDADTLEDLIEHLNSLSDEVNPENPDENSQISAKGKKKASNKKKAKDTAEYLPDECDGKVEKRKRKTAKKVSEGIVCIDDSENTVEFVSQEADFISAGCEKVTKKRRKPKKLPDDFVDSSVIEDIAEIVCEETNNNDAVLELTLNNSLERNHDSNDLSSEKNKLNAIPLDDSSNATKLNPENSLDTRNSILQLSDNYNNEMEFVTIEYVENVESVSEPTLSSNVMAFEVVSSQIPATKRKRKMNTPIIPKRKLMEETCIPVQLSSTNYTPV